MLKKIVALTSVAVITSYFYAKVKEKRSYKSFLYEATIRVTQMKKPFESVEHARKMLEVVMKDTEGPHKDTDYNFRNHVQTTTIQNVTTYIVDDKSDRQQRVVLYLHGGAWFQDPIKTHFEYIDLLVDELDAKVIMPVYPKIPHATYKETFELLTEIYKTIVAQVEYPEQVIIMGDSTGGQIALSFAQYIKILGLAQPSNIVLISPVLDATLSNPEAPAYEKIDPMLGINGTLYFMKLWAGDIPLTDWRVSPIYGTLDGLGHITISIGTKETLYPDAVKLSNLLNEKNIEHDFFLGYNLFHIHQIFPIPERRQFLEQLKQIINKY
ncbi:alpha/beta hydrolase [Staphylococcus equorum]|uniref:Alpha/beta hydrolase n=1 Tax=Staphylococcus equorum TaxID=246432 RepID=A0A9X4R1B1_9STAP|nr:alpha/beta hydrolase [Staphylococcus equorum]MDG0843740.1 alpha/beta hydrolase [Staphylococcus equorum]MDG0859737.1 alpha/beta hydrolase [Staphylococcus equorum]